MEITLLLEVTAYQQARVYSPESKEEYLVDITDNQSAFYQSLLKNAKDHEDVYIKLDKETMQLTYIDNNERQRKGKIMNYSYPEELSSEQYELDRKQSKEELLSKFLQLAKVEDSKIQELVEKEINITELFNRPSVFGLTEQQSETIKELKFLIDWEGGETYDVNPH